MALVAYSQAREKSQLSSYEKMCGLQCIAQETKTLMAVFCELIQGGWGGGPVNCRDNPAVCLNLQSKSYRTEYLMSSNQKRMISRLIYTEVQEYLYYRWLRWPLVSGPDCECVMNGGCQAGSSRHLSIFVAICSDRSYSLQQPGFTPASRVINFMTMDFSLKALIYSLLDIRLQRNTIY